jgi:hypothetical protein
MFTILCDVPEACVSTLVGSLMQPDTFQMNFQSWHPRLSLFLSPNGPIHRYLQNFGSSDPGKTTSTWSDWHSARSHLTYKVVTSGVLSQELTYWLTRDQTSKSLDHDAHKSQRKAHSGGFPLPHLAHEGV